MIGKTISHYKILEKIGSGGMGIVYKARDLKLDRFVALKFLPPHLTSSDEEKQRFIREAKSASSLDHHNICNIHEIDETEEGQLFISMAFYEGETLDKKIKEKPLPIEEAIDIAIQIAEGLARAHEKEIVHRDIKPANIMITKDGLVKVLDFGLAKLSTQTKLTKESTTLGTVSYMSPEQAKGEEVDDRTDIWSLAVILYEILTGQLPFKGDYDSAVIYSILNDSHEPVTGLRTGVPLELERIIDKCLQKNPRNRYQHIEDLIVDLCSIQKEYGSSEDATKISEIKKDKNPRIIQLTKPGFIVLAVIIVAFIYFTMFQKAESRSPIPIAVVDFVNETGDKELSSLSGMLTTALEQSRRLTVITRSRMFDILKQLNKEHVDYIDEKLGREIANQAGIKVLVLASVQKFDQLYNIDLKVIDPLADKYLFTASEKDEGKSKIPKMIDRLAEKTRQGLEESAEDIQLNAKPVAELTTPNLEAYQHYFKGQEYTDKLMFEDAEKEFNLAIGIDSAFGLAYYGLAYALDWERNEEKAKAEINKAYKYIDKIPDKERYLVNFVKMTVDSGWGKAALKILREMEKIYPDDKEMLYNIGDVSYHIGDYEQAENYLKKVLEIDPKSVRTKQHLIFTYQELERYEDLIETVHQYNKFAGDAIVYTAYAEAYINIGDFDSGINELKKQMEIYPERKVNIAPALTLLYFKKGENEKAGKIFNFFLENFGNDISTNIEFGWSLYRLSRYDEAIKVFSRLLKENPNNPFVLNGLGWSHMKQGKYEQAEKHFRKGYDLNKSDPGIINGLVWAGIRLNKYAEAEKYAEIYRKRISRYWGEWTLADIKLLRKDYESAEEHLDKAYQADSTQSDIFGLYGYVFALQKQYTKALYYAEKALMSDSSYINYNLYSWILVQGDIDIEKGISYAQKAQEIDLNKNHLDRGHPYYALPEYTIGLGYLKRGDNKRAVYNLEIANRLLPERKDIISDLQSARNKLDTALSRVQRSRIDH